MLAKKRLMLILVVALCVSVVVVIIKFSSGDPLPMEKIGKVKDMNYWSWWDPGKPPVTILRFEDGDAMHFVGQIESVEVGGTYRIVYREARIDFIGEWSGNFYVVDSVEKIG